MITRLWSLTLLVSLLVLAFDHSIDLTRCKSDTACFVRESCLDGKDKNNVLVQYKDPATTKLKGPECDVVLQIKSLNEYNLHVMIQVLLSSDKIKTEDGIKLNQGTDQFVCKPGVKAGDALITVDRAFQFVKKGRQIFEDQHLFCSFSTESPKRIEEVFLANTDKPKLIFTKATGTKETIEFATNSKGLWQLLPVTCNYDLVTSSTKDSTEKDEVWTEVNMLAANLKCDSSFIVKKESEDTPIVTKRVECALANIWEYEDSEGEMQDLGGFIGKFEIYCPAKRCRQCTTAPPQLNCAGCTNTTFAAAAAASPTGCPTLTCPTTNDKWTLNGKNIIDGQAECKGDVDPTKSKWLVAGQNLDKAACMDKIPCSDTPPLKDDSQREKIDGLGTDTIKCKNSGEIFTDEGGKQMGSTIDLARFCNTETGEYNFTALECTTNANADSSKVVTGGGGNGLPIYAWVGIGLLIFLPILLAVLMLKWYWWEPKQQKKKKAAAAGSKDPVSAKKSAKSTNNSTQSTAPPGEVGADGSEGKKKSTSRKSKKSKRDKLKLEDFPTWDNEQFTKKILPNFKTFDPDSQGKWVRNFLSRFYAYSNTKKAPESGTFNQFWLLVKQCADDKCEVASVWVELWRCAFTIGYSVTEKTTVNDEMRARLMKPFETYMLEYIKKCDFFKRKDEPRSETEMRIICIEVLLHTRHPDATDTLRKLTYNEKLEVPLRMITAACYTRERDEKPKTVDEQYKRVLEQSVLDPHIAEGWGTFLQHCIFGLGAYLITEKNVYQYKFFEEIYQVQLQKDPVAPRKFSPSDWMYAYKGASLHENSAKIALEMFKKFNDDCLLHIDTLLKQKHADDADEREKDREQYKKDMKEYTMLLADLLIGEEDFNEFKSHLRFVILFIGDLATTGEPLSEERIRERAINMGNMVRDRNFTKECNESLKAIGAKTD